jgi:uncharacterized membrane protein YkoI
MRMMRMTRREFLTTTLWASLLVVAPPQLAYAKKDPSSQTEEKKQQQKKKAQKRKQQQGQDAAISRDRAAALARSSTGGRVLSVKRQGGSYRVRVLLDGKRVRTVGVDARSGTVSK